MQQGVKYFFLGYESLHSLIMNAAVFISFLCAVYTRKESKNERKYHKVNTFDFSDAKIDRYIFKDSLLSNELLL